MGYVSDAFTTEYNAHKGTMKRVKAYGQTAIPDCPDNGNYCKQIEKGGFMIGHGTHVGKDVHITAPSALPSHKIKSMASWYQDFEFEDMEFHNFTKTTTEGFMQRVFVHNPYAPDYIGMHKFKRTKFVDVEDGALTYIYEPPQKWAIIKDCGEWPCTGPKNILFDFEDTTW